MHFLGFRSSFCCHFLCTGCVLGSMPGVLGTLFRWMLTPTLLVSVPILHEARLRGAGYTMRLPRWLRGLRIQLECRRLEFSPWIGKIRWRREWQSTPIFLPG